MKVLIIGSGGREHALAWKLKQSHKVNHIFCAPGNAGIAEIATCIDTPVNDIKELCEFAKANEIDLTVVGLEYPLSLGIVDKFQKEGLVIYGPTKNAARIETSKGFAKKFMHKYKIPTPHFKVLDREQLAIEYVKKAHYPIVVKYDGLSQGKGSFICETFSEARKVIQSAFKNLQKAVVIEKFIKGREISFQVITDGYSAVPLPSSKDYKKSLEGDGGTMTGGMGAYSPVSYLTPELESKIANKIIFPAIDGMSNDKNPFVGTLYAGLIIDENNNPWVLEFNARFGDPETQTILPLIDEDLFDVLYSAAIGALGDEYEFLKISDDAVVSVTLASGGYPFEYKTGKVIEGLEEIDNDDIMVFHSGTKKNIYGETVTDGGRVLTLSATASTLSRAQSRVYEDIEIIDFFNKRYRSDIAKEEIYKIETLL